MRLKPKPGQELKPGSNLCTQDILVSRFFTARKNWWKNTHVRHPSTTYLPLCLLFARMDSHYKQQVGEKNIIYNSFLISSKRERSRICLFCCNLEEERVRGKASCITGCGDLREWERFARVNGSPFETERKKITKLWEKVDMYLAGRQADELNFFLGWICLCIFGEEFTFQLNSGTPGSILSKIRIT